MAGAEVELSAGNCLLLCCENWPSSAEPLSQLLVWSSSLPSCLSWARAMRRRASNALGSAAEDPLRQPLRARGDGDPEGACKSLQAGRRLQHVKKADAL